MLHCPDILDHDEYLDYMGYSWTNLAPEDIHALFYIYVPAQPWTELVHELAGPTMIFPVYGSAGQFMILRVVIAHDCSK